jgi:hypothetical protein
MVLLAYDVFWVFSGVLSQPTVPPTTSSTMTTTMSMSTMMTTTTTFHTTLPPQPTPPPHRESAMMRMARGIISNGPGCYVKDFAFFRPCFPTLPMLVLFPRWLSEGEVLIGLVSDWKTGGFFLGCRTF